MSNDRIGTAQKNPGVLSQPESAGVAFEVPYGEDKYGITLSNGEMDLLLTQGYEALMGQAVIGSGCVIELESPDLPLFTHTLSLHIGKEQGRSAIVNIGVGILTQSVVYEHRGILSASRHGMDGTWEFEGYEIQPPLRDPEADSERTPQAA